MGWISTTSFGTRNPKIIEWPVIKALWLYFLLLLICFCISFYTFFSYLTAFSLTYFILSSFYFSSFLFLLNWLIFHTFRDHFRTIFIWYFLMHTLHFLRFHKITPDPVKFLAELINDDFVGGYDDILPVWGKALHGPVAGAGDADAALWNVDWILALTFRFIDLLFALFFVVFLCDAFTLLQFPLGHFCDASLRILFFSFSLIPRVNKTEFVMHTHGSVLEKYWNS